MPIFSKWFEKPKDVVSRKKTSLFSRPVEPRMDGVESIIENDKTADYVPDSDVDTQPKTISTLSLDSGAPQRQKLFDKEHLLGSLLTIGLPAIYGATQGVGLFPGAAAGAAGLGKATEDKYKNDVEKYHDEQVAQQNKDYRDAMIRHQVDELNYKKNKAPAAIETEAAIEARVQSILNKRKAGQPISATEAAFARDWMESKNKQGLANKKTAEAAGVENYGE